MSNTRAWTDAFVSPDPPSYITEHLDRSRREEEVERWSGTRWDDARRALERWLGFFPDPPSVEKVIRVLEEDADPEIGLALLLASGRIRDEDDFLEVSHLARTFLDARCRADYLLDRAEEVSGQFAEMQSQAATRRAMTRRLQSQRNLLAGIFLLAFLFLLMT
jgi:hypothetical protein